MEPHFGPLVLSNLANPRIFRRIQTLVPLSDGSAVSVTVAQYRTPNGTNINKIGITPDKALPLKDDGTDAVPSNAADFCSYASSAPSILL